MSRLPARPSIVRAALLALGLGVGLSLACKTGGGGSEAPGDVTSVEGPAYCPRAVPGNGSSCPRGSNDFCVYRTTTTDFACVCGSGTWSCAAK